MSAFGVKRCKNVFLLGISHILRKHNLGLFGFPSLPMQAYVHSTNIFSNEYKQRRPIFDPPPHLPPLSAYVIYEWSPSYAPLKCLGGVCGSLLSGSKDQCPTGCDSHQKAHSYITFSELDYKSEEVVKRL